MTTPSGVFLTQPASPSPVASRTTNGRKPTPCTRPSKHIRTAAKPAEADGQPADSGPSIPPPSTIFQFSPMEPDAAARKMVAEARHSPIPETTTYGTTFFHSLPMRLCVLAGCSGPRRDPGRRDVKGHHARSAAADLGRDGSAEAGERETRGTDGPGDCHSQGRCFRGHRVAR